jgi:hypothetical protein
MHYCSTQSQMLDQTNLWFLSCCETGEIKFRLMIMLQDVYPKNKMFCWGIIKNCKVFSNLIVMEILLFILRLKGDDTFIFLLYLQLWDEKIVFLSKQRMWKKDYYNFVNCQTKFWYWSNSIMKTIVPAIVYEYFVDN